MLYCIQMCYCMVENVQMYTNINLQCHFYGFLIYILTFSSLKLHIIVQYSTTAACHSDPQICHEKHENYIF